MNSRERVLLTLSHREPDRVPFNLRPSDGMRRRLREEQGAAGLDFPEFFRHDVRIVPIPVTPCPPGVPAREWTPGPSAEDTAACARRTRELQERGLAVCAGYACGVFEQAKHWFGDERTLTMPYEEPALLEKELERITLWKMEVYGAYARAGVDILWMGDDLGGQRNLVMSPLQYRRWYRPCHERIVRHLRGIRPEAKIAFHCCGFVTTLIPDLIEVGIDVLEAVQAECMDLEALKRDFGRDLSFWGGVGAQSVLARTTPREVEEGVRRTLAVMGPGGGYIAAPCHTLTEEVPWESILAFHEAVRAYGRYPL